MRIPTEPSKRERFESTVLVHLDAAYNLARWTLRDDSSAEDVVQDACLRAFRYFDGMHGPTPKAWFMAIVRNACMDWFSANRRHELDESFEDSEHAGAVSAWSADSAESPESLAIRADDRRLLRASLETLPIEFREVLILREMEELSYREISAVVGVPIGTVMSRLSRGRQQLAHLLRAGHERKAS